MNQTALSKISICEATNFVTTQVEELVSKNISLSRADWDSFETSWDFKRHPLINGEPTLAKAFAKWEREAADRFNQLKANEEALNRIFIDIYGLHDELTPEVDDKDVTVRRADKNREVKSFVSYVVGCMFGRYSLDVEGLAFAGNDWKASAVDVEKYQTYRPTLENVIPITDADYFDDDIIVRFEEFVKKAYGERSLEENLEFIANALYPDVDLSARKRIRRYFTSGDFYKDHVKIYQKRPIYWQFEVQGKLNSFKALIYLHRYSKYDVGTVRNEYLHILQRRMTIEIERLEVMAEDASASEKAAYKKETERLTKQIAECKEYDPIISYFSHRNIELDLDDGVAVNYAKFQGIEVSRGIGYTPVKMDLLSKI
jgi:hypothetical protein